jgi:uncharacterized membrane protein
MRLPKITSPVMLAIFLLCAVWVALVAVSPFLVPAHTLRDLSGRVSVRDNTAQFMHLDALPKAIYSIGDVECHQIASRTLFMNGNEMPFCARDFGLFIGLAFGFGLMTFRRYKVNPILALVGLVPMGIDGGLQLVTSYESNNPLRLATGIIAGSALALLIALYVFLLSEDSRDSRARRSGSGKENAPEDRVR